MVEQVICRVRTNWGKGLYRDLDIVADIKKKKTGMDRASNKN